MFFKCSFPGIADPRAHSPLCYVLLHSRVVLRVGLGLVISDDRHSVAFSPFENFVLRVQFRHRFVEPKSPGVQVCKKCQGD